MIKILILLVFVLNNVNAGEFGRSCSVYSSSILSLNMITKNIEMDNNSIIKKYSSTDIQLNNDFIAIPYIFNLLYLHILFLHQKV